MPGETQTPLADMLRAAQGRTRMHMPGHKGETPPGWQPFAWDMTELACTDDLFAPERGIAQAEALAARSAEAGATLMLSGGGTAGVLAMVLSFVRPGGTLIVPRDCHHSVLSACVWGDIEPVFVWPRECGLPYVDAGDVERTLAAHPQAEAVLITRPDYRGVCADGARIARAAHERGMRLLVDEAHGAHWNWRVAGFDREISAQPQSAGVLGADAWVQSAHKTLPALTGGAWLHLRNADEQARVRAMLRMVHTSSPSFPILASVDGARAWMDARGGEALAALHARIGAFWEALRAGAPGMRNAHDALLESTETNGVCVDPARIVLDATRHGYTGTEVAEWLRARGIDVEMADARHAVLIPTVCDVPDVSGAPGALERVAEALCALPARESLPVPEPLTLRDARAVSEVQSAPEAPPERVLRVREAALSLEELVPLAQAAGRISARCAGVYPPGVPLIVPGERVTEAIAQALEASAQRFGVEEGGLRCVREPWA